MYHVSINENKSEWQGLRVETKEFFVTQTLHEIKFKETTSA